MNLDRSKIFINIIKKRLQFEDEIKKLRKNRKILGKFKERIPSTDKKSQQFRMGYITSGYLILILFFYK